MADPPRYSPPQGFEERPPDRGCCGTCLNYLHNSKSGTYCGKTCCNWLLIILFYVLFLTTWVTILYGIVYLNLMNIKSISYPWLTDGHNVMGSPGVGFRPLIQKNQHGPLIWWTWEADSRRHYPEYTSIIKKFLAKYRKTSDNEICEDLNSSKKRDKPCFFNTSLLGPCGAPEYGYDQNAPCIYLKLNKLYGWTPDCYSDPKNIPDHMPPALKLAIANQSVVEPKKFAHVWVSCSGVFPADEQHMGDTQFYPLPGFQPGYFPYLMQEGYRTPVIAVQFLRPDRNVVITVQCTAWAHNLEEKPVEIQIMVGRNPLVDDVDNTTENSNNSSVTEPTELE